MWSRFTIAAIAVAAVGGIADTGIARATVATPTTTTRPTAATTPTTMADPRSRFRSEAADIGVDIATGAVGTSTEEGAGAGKR